MAFSEEKAKDEHDKRQKKFTEEDLGKILDKDEELKDKFKNQSKLSKYWEEFKILLSMVKDYAKGDYREIPWYTISSIGATLLYVLSPIDLIPDFIPIVGYLDDAAIFAFCLNMVREDISKYEEWKRNY